MVRTRVGFTWYAFVVCSLILIYPSMMLGNQHWGFLGIPLEIFFWLRVKIRKFFIFSRSQIELLIVFIENFLCFNTD